MLCPREASKPKDNLSINHAFNNEARGMLRIRWSHTYKSNERSKAETLYACMHELFRDWNLLRGAARCDHH